MNKIRWKDGKNTFQEILNRDIIRKEEEEEEEDARKQRELTINTEIALKLEILQAFRPLRSGKALGTDRFPPEVLKADPDVKTGSLRRYG
jgi:hypothetical protein